MPEDKTAENVPETLSASGLSDGDAWAEQLTPALEYAQEAEPSAEDCNLNDPKDRSGNMDERLPGDDKTVNRP